MVGDGAAQATRSQVQQEDTHAAFGRLPACPLSLFDPLVPAVPGARLSGCASLNLGAASALLQAGGALFYLGCSAALQSAGRGRAKAKGEANFWTGRTEYRLRLRGVGARHPNLRVLSLPRFPAS
jgi:hypothetical protein